MFLEDINRSRKRLFDGLRRFKREVYPNRQVEYRQAVKEGQKPHALFITCADSRIDPEMITQSGPGEIFVSRNIGNMVPPYGEALGSVSAIIEYAVAGLQVSHVVVCGHSDCGALIGLLHPEKVARLPIMKSWLRHGETAVSFVRSSNTAQDDNTALEELTEANVLLQMDHLRTHPSVAERLAQGSLALSGWVYDIADGIVRVYDESQRKFLGVTPEERAGVGGSSK